MKAKARATTEMLRKGFDLAVERRAVAAL